MSTPQEPGTPMPEPPEWEPGEPPTPPEREPGEMTPDGPAMPDRPDVPGESPDVPGEERS